MATTSTEAVIAGSRGFALALLAPLTERVGNRPRIAADPTQALALCNGAGLVVVEFQGEGSLRAIQELVLRGPELKIIAAVPDAHAGAEGTLRALGVELARWDGKPDGVLGAVTRQLAAAAPPRASAAPAPIAPSAPPPPAAVLPAAPRPAPARAAASSAAPFAPRLSTASPGGGLFDDLGTDDDDFHVDVSDLADGRMAVPSFLAAGPWPANGPSAVEAADALGRGLAGRFDPRGRPLAAVADVVGSLTELERAVFAGVPQAIDTEPIRRAAVMRVRVQVALATAPATRGDVDGVAISALLAEIDALLSDVNVVAQAAPPGLQPALEQVRNSLVKEAIDFSEAAHRVQPAELAPGRGPPAARARTPQARVGSIESKAGRAVANARSKRNRAAYLVLALSGLAAAAFYGYR